MSCKEESLQHRCLVGSTWKIRHGAGSIAADGHIGRSPVRLITHLRTLHDTNSPAVYMQPSHRHTAACSAPDCTFRLRIAPLY